MNKQLAHVAYSRDKSWNHTIWIPQLRPEFELAWSEFQRSIVDPEYRDAFAAHLQRKQDLLNLP
jgi:hypothetical protein